MQLSQRSSDRRTLAVLHPVFALTGVLHAIGGALLPALALTFQLNDNDSGLLFLLYFAGSSLGALLCRAHYARTMALGFVAAMACCLGVTAAGRPMLPAIFLLLGVSVGVPMTAVNLFVGRAFPERCASLLTSLNFSWSVGALVAPLLAARILLHHQFRVAYLVLASASAIAALLCGLMLRDQPPPQRMTIGRQDATALRLILVFALAAFLQVGVENTAAAWLPTYAQRMAAGGVVFAAASSSFYWAGFLASRGFSSLLLMRTDPIKVFRMAVIGALAAAILLPATTTSAQRSVVMFVLGAALAPVYPLLIAVFFSRARLTSDSRWVMATAGFGGSVLPWIAGWISAHSGSLRIGLFTMPAALLLMIFVLPALRGAKIIIADG